MSILNIAPTKSNLLVLKRQNAFAEEGYDLLEQKRQILILGLMSRLNRACEVERRVAGLLQNAFTALREAALEVGSVAIDRAAMSIAMDHQVAIADQHLMGLHIPRVTSRIEAAGVRFGVGGTSAHADAAMLRFVDVLSLITELAELENAVRRLARELRKTQRRCNTLSKVLIPTYQQTIAYIVAALEERERESFVILKMVRDRLLSAG